MEKMTGNLDLIKRINRSLVLDKIRNEKSISRAKIAKQLNLSRSTVSSIVDDLLAKKFVVELGYGNSTKDGGRRGVELGFNPKSAFGLGVDIGGTKILIVITDLDGCVVYKEKVKTTNKVEEIVHIIHSSLEKAGVQEKDIVGMGVGVPSITNNKEGIVIDAYALNWSNLNLKKELHRYFSFPIFVDNDVNCAALGEQWLGSGERSNDMIFIAIGTGVGSAIISNGRLIQGHNFQAGEIAYNICEEDIRAGRMNKVGEFGVFEKKTSGKFLAQDGLMASELFKEYKRNNQQVVPIIDRFILHLSINISNAINLLNPERVVIGGGVSESMEVVLDKIRQTVDELTPIKTTIELATLGGDAGGLGAIAYAFREVEESNML